MPKRTLDEYWADDLKDSLAEHGLHHLRVRRRGDLLVIESGPAKSPVAHARFRRETVHLWRLEVASHDGSWEPTPLRDNLDRLLSALVTQFPWALEARD